MAKNVENSLKDLTEINGFIAAALVDADSGMSMGEVGGGDDFDVEVAAAANTDVVNAKLRAVEALELDDGIDDILITLGGQYHLIRPLESRPQIFFYLALDRKQSNLAMARMKVSDVADNLKI